MDCESSDVDDGTTAAEPPVNPTGTLCATAARRRSLARGGARVRKLTPSHSPYRPVRVLEREVMVSLAEEDEHELHDPTVRWRTPSPRRRNESPYYFKTPPQSPRKVQYCHSPEVHEYTKESTGSYRGPRYEQKSDGTVVALGNDQAASVIIARAGDVMEAAETVLQLPESIMGAGGRATAFNKVVCSPATHESNVITVLEQQTKGGQQQQIIQVVEDCSCFDTEPKPHTPPEAKVQNSPCNECWGEMYFYGKAEQPRPVSGGAKPPAQVRVLQETTYQETNDDRLQSLQMRQEHVHDNVQDVRYESPPVRAMPRSRESNLGAVAEPAIRIIHEERLIDPNAPVKREEPLVVHSPKEAASTAASAGKEEPKPDFVMDPSIIPVKSLSEVRIIQDFPKFDVPASVRIIPSAAGAGSKAGQGGLPEAIPVPYEPLHILKEERRFEAVNLIRDSQRSDSQHRLVGKERSLESSPGGRGRSASRELGRKISRTHAHHTLSNHSQESVAREDISDEESRKKRLALVPFGQRGHVSRKSSHEAYRARSYEQPRDSVSPPRIHIQSRRRPAGLHIALERPEPPRLPLSDRARRDKFPLDKPRDPSVADRRTFERIFSRSPSPFDPQLRSPEVPPIDTRSAPMDEVARHAWKQYSQEYQRYLSNLAEWNQQQDLLRSQLGNLESGSSGHESDGARSVASQEADLEQGPVRIRIALSGNSLRGGRSCTASPSEMSPLSSPRPGSKHVVCTESISLIDTVKGPETPRCSSHIEANRQRRARVAKEDLEASFEERRDRRVHMTPLCSEHMSYRAFINNSPQTRPPPRSETKKGTPLSRLLPVMPVTKHYMERIDFPDSPERRQIPPRKDRRQFVYPMLQKMGIPKDFLVYFLVSVATLASVFAVIGVYSKHERNLSEHATLNAPAAVSLHSENSSLFVGYKRHAKTVTGFDVCKTADCQREGSYLARHLSWSIEPCDDFRAFVCNKPGPAPLTTLVRSVAKVVGRKSARAEMMPLKQLHDRCMQVGSRNWSQLRAAFALLSLDGWPFQDSRDISHDLVWEVAAALERSLGASTLVGVSARPQSKLVVLAKVKAWPQSRDNVMKSHFTKCAKALRPSTEDAEKLTAEVLSFVRKLNALPNLHPNKRARSNATPYSRFVSLLGLGADREVLFSEEMTSQLTRGVKDTAPHAVLNYQGLLAAEKMSLLLPGSKVNEESCWQLVREVLPELYLYAVYRERGSALKDPTDVTESIRSNVILYVNAASWMEASVRKQAVERLRGLRVLAFVPAWFSDAKRVHAEFGSLPRPRMDNGPLAYVTLKEHTHGRQLRGEAWPVSPDSSECFFDGSLRTVYVPLLATNMTRVQSWPLGLARLPTLGTHLAACMMHAVTAEADRWWGRRSLRKLEPLRKCVDSSHGGEALLNRMAALAPAHSAYSSRLRSTTNAAGGREYRLPHTENVTAQQMFFIEFARAHCHGPAELINVPLQSYEPFRRVFGCHPGARMSPAKTCRFWAS